METPDPYYGSIQKVQARFSPLCSLLTGLFLLSVGLILSISGQNMDFRTKFMLFGPMISALFWRMLFGRSNAVYCIALILGSAYLFHQRAELRASQSHVTEMRSSDEEIRSSIANFQQTCAEWAKDPGTKPVPSAEPLIHVLRQRGRGPGEDAACLRAMADFIELFNAKQHDMAKGLSGLQTQPVVWSSSGEELTKSIGLLKDWKKSILAFEDYRRHAHKQFVELLGSEGCRPDHVADVADLWSQKITGNQELAALNTSTRKLAECSIACREFLLKHWGEWRWCDERHTFIFDNAQTLAAFRDLLTALKTEGATVLGHAQSIREAIASRPG